MTVPSARFNAANSVVKCYRMNVSRMQGTLELKSSITSKATTTPNANTRPSDTKPRASLRPSFTPQNNAQNGPKISCTSTVTSTCSPQRSLWRRHARRSGIKPVRRGASNPARRSLRTSTPSCEGGAGTSNTAIPGRGDVPWSVKSCE